MGYKQKSPRRRTSKSRAVKAILPPLLAASEAGDTQTVQKLLNSGVDVNLRCDPKMAGYHGATSLILAVRHGYYATAKVLLEHGANHSSEAAYGNPLSEAITHGHTNLVELLLSKSARNPDCSLFNAVEKGRLEILHLVADAGVPLAKMRSRFGDSLLERAVYYRKTEIVHLLLKYIGKDFDGGALVQAAAQGNDKLVRLLTESGANVNQPNSLLQFPIGSAAFSGNRATIELLLELGADISMIDIHGWSCIDWALYGKQSKVAKWLDSVGKSRGVKIPRGACQGGKP